MSGNINYILRRRWIAPNTFATSIDRSYCCSKRRYSYTCIMYRVDVSEIINLGAYQKFKNKIICRCKHLIYLTKNLRHYACQIETVFICSRQYLQLIKLKKWKKHCMHGLTSVVSAHLIGGHGHFVCYQAYLPGIGDTLILKEVPPWRGLSIALRAGWPERSPQMWATRMRNLC